MKHSEWNIKHKALIASIVLTHQFKTVEDEVEYFQYDNMIRTDPDFCPLYKSKQICHPMKELNCRCCACPHFSYNQDETRFSCKARGILSSPEASFLPCNTCTIPHTQKFVTTYLKGTYESKS